MTLRIGISARLLHNPPAGLGLPQKRLQFLESSIANWVMGRGAIALLVPFVDEASAAIVDLAPMDDTVALLDGLILQGGVDVCPEAYGATAIRPEWRGDPGRDRYELALLHGFITSGKPVLGVCRGAQLMNVYFGGTLIQDIPTMVPGAQAHEHAGQYDRLVHDVEFAPGSRLAGLYPSGLRHKVNSIHHQCVDRIGEGLVVEARCAADGVVEAIRHTGPGFAMGVQWHPEFHLTPGEAQLDLLDSGPIMQSFLDAARTRSERYRPRRSVEPTHG